MRVSEVQRLELQPHRAGLGLRDVHQRAEHPGDPIGFLQALGQAFAQRRGILRLQRGLGNPAQPGERRAQVVRHVVEGAAHARDHRVDAVEHRVEEHA